MSAPHQKFYADEIERETGIRPRFPARELVQIAKRSSSVRCPFRVSMPLERRPANALNVEIGQAADRCTLKDPDQVDARRWLGSGGSPLVLGRCVMNYTCPKLVR